MKISFNQLNTAYQEADAPSRLIYINGAVFVFIKLIVIISWLFAVNNSIANNWILQNFAVPTDIQSLLFHPWTIFTYMFVHIGVLHILFNMIALYFGGKLFVQFLGDKKVWSLYINGGLAGALLYIISFNLFPVFGDATPLSRAIGASASIMAILAGIAAYRPNLEIRMMIIGNIKLKWIVIFLFIVDLLSITQSNSGGHLSHIGGAVFGYIFAIQLKKGRDITAWIWPISDFFKKVFSFKRKKRFKVSYKSPTPKSDYQYNAQKAKKQHLIDEILDKISKSGYDSLSKEEKDFLFNQSNK